MSFRPNALPADASGFHAVRRLPMNSVRRRPSVALDGRWDFQLLPTPDSPLSDSWSHAQVPGLWTMTNSDDPPGYTNVPMPFDEVPPTIPPENPTGVYRRFFESPELRDGHRLILHVGAAEGLLKVYVNETAVGSSTDSHLSAEFEITAALKPGLNEIILAVAKWSSVTYLEDQDQWWQSGLPRSIHLVEVPSIRLADCLSHADFDPGTRKGALNLRVMTHGLDQEGTNDFTVRMVFRGQAHEAPVTPRTAAWTIPREAVDRSVRPQAKYPPDFADIRFLVAAGADLPAEAQNVAGIAGPHTSRGTPAGEVVFALDELDVKPWTAESPNLEELRIELLDGSGRIIDQELRRIGFKRVEIRDGELLVNGKPVMIQGINRHDSHPTTGRVLTRQDYLDELSLLKRFNINAIRTAHYPNDPQFLDLCDEIGFYVVDEADVEGHAFASIIADDPRYLEPMVERVKRMVLRDRNHACVIIWSIGNETGDGAAHAAAAAWLRRFDPTRPVQYAGPMLKNWHGGRDVTDIVCPMYASIESIRSFARDPRRDRPFILSEYAYSQGNSGGGFRDYWDAFDTLPGVQGGFIWQFKDHALDPDGDGRWRYGGDFGERIHSGAVLLNGVVFADLTPKPVFYEIRGVFSPVRIVSGADELKSGRMTIVNRQTFTTLERLSGELVVRTTHGSTSAVPVELGTVPAGARGEIQIPPAVLDRVDSPDVLAIDLVVRTKYDETWAPKGTEVAILQTVLNDRPRAVLSRRGRTPNLSEDGEIMHSLLREPPRLCLWRALTDNDRSWALDNRFIRSGFFQLTRVGVTIKRSEDAAHVAVEYETAYGEPIKHGRWITELGEDDYLLTEHVQLPAETSDGLRVGMRYELIQGFDRVEWVGLGPWENYPDRADSALLGRWSDRIDDLAVPYVLPQENGTRGGVIEARISGPAGEVRSEHSAPLHINVARNSAAELEDSTHWWTLPRHQTATVHLDVAHRGIGTAQLGPDTPPRYRLTATEYAWSWRLTFT